MTLPLLLGSREQEELGGNVRALLKRGHGLQPLMYSPWQSIME